MFLFLTAPAGLIDVTGSSVLPYWNGLGCFFLVLQRFLKFFSASESKKRKQHFDFGPQQYKYLTLPPCLPPDTEAQGTGTSWVWKCEGMSGGQCMFVLQLWNSIINKTSKGLKARCVLWPNLFWVRPPCPAQGIVCFYARISNTPSSQSQNNCWRMTRTICELTWTNKCHHFSNCFLKDFEKWLCQGFRKGLLWDVKRPWCALVYLCIGKIWNSLDTKLWKCRKIWMEVVKSRSPAHSKNTLTKEEVSRLHCTLH